MNLIEIWVIQMTAWRSQNFRFVSIGEIELIIQMRLFTLCKFTQMTGRLLKWIKVDASFFQSVSYAAE